MTKRDIKFVLFFIMFFCFAQVSCIVPLSYAKTGNTVYITPKGKKYHDRDCKTLVKSTKVSKTTVQQAKKQGYKSCKVCYPKQ